MYDRALAVGSRLRRAKIGVSSSESDSSIVRGQRV
jgi:hypothetical protein